MYRSIQKYAEVCRDMQRYAEIYRGMQRYTEVCSSIQKYAEVCRGMQRYAEVCSSIQKYAEVCRDMQKYTRYDTVHCYIHVTYCNVIEFSLQLMNLSQQVRPG